MKATNKANRIERIITTAPRGFWVVRTDGGKKFFANGRRLENYLETNGYQEWLKETADNRRDNIRKAFGMSN